MAGWALVAWLLLTTHQLQGQVGTLNVRVEVRGKQVAMLNALESRIVRLEQAWGR